MKRLNVLLAAVLLAAATQPTSAQIVFDQNFWLSQAGVLRTFTFHDRSSLDISPLSTDEMNTITDIVDNRKGADQVYDFSSIAYDLRGTQEQTFLTSPAGLPGATDPDLANANFVSSNQFPGFGAFYIYYQLYPDSLIQLGTFSESSFGDQLIKYSPPKLEYALPLTNGTTWTSVFTSSIGGSTMTLDATVEGYGTLKLPGGIEAEALRIMTSSGSLIFGSTTYEFLTLEGNVAIVEYETDFFGARTLSTISYAAVSSTGTATESADEVPDRIALAQNYPNPFNPSTVIPFDLSSAGPVALRVYDALGREVASVFEGTLPAGRHEITWNPVDVPSGVYYYRLEGAGDSVTRSLQLVR